MTNLRSALARFPESTVVFSLPGGELIPADFHVTEVGYVAKHFIDCGGTVRRNEACLLQTWVSEGGSRHRLSAGKLAQIMDLSRAVLPAAELEVELEYGSDPVGQFQVDSVDGGELQTRFRLANKKTDCLARESCGVESIGVGCESGGNAGQCC